MSVLPDVAAIDRTFFYAVPEAWRADGRAHRLRVGSMVRVYLHGRRVNGWVTEIGARPPSGMELSPLVRLRGLGPPADLISLAGWAAWRWAGSRSTFLRLASPPRLVAGVVSGPVPPPRPVRPEAESGAGYEAAFETTPQSPVAVLRLPPPQDPVPVALAAARRGDALVIVPESTMARRVARALRQVGVRVAVTPEGWATAAGGGCTVVGSRAAAWMPMADPAAVVVFDEHDEALKSSSAPTWNARDVALERARRAGCPAVLTSPTPSLEALRAGRLLRPDRAAEREGWPRIEVIDRRYDDPTKGGLFAEGFRARLPDTGPVICVLNRTGRSRLLACAACGELARTDDGRAAMMIDEAMLVAADGSEARPAVCAKCGSTVLRNLRMGVTRAREELEALLGEPVGEVTAGTGATGVGAGSDHRFEPRVMIGTTAVLHRAGEAAAAVVFLDFDQELLAPRQRAAEQALGLLARAARVLGGRSGGGRLVVQTRQPDHAVLAAARRADPSILATAERDHRRLLSIPPYGAQAQVSGPGAPGLVESLGVGVEVRGPRRGSYLLKSAGHEPLLDALAAAGRPMEPVRVEVDPLRV